MISNVVRIFGGRKTTSGKGIRKMEIMKMKHL